MKAQNVNWSMCRNVKLWRYRHTPDEFHLSVRLGCTLLYAFAPRYDRLLFFYHADMKKDTVVLHYCCWSMLYFEDGEKLMQIKMLAVVDIEMIRLYCLRNDLRRRLYMIPLLSFAVVVVVFLQKNFLSK